MGVGLSGKKRTEGLLSRLLLAVLLTLGVAAMHTFGHIDGPHAPLPDTSSALHISGDHSTTPDSHHGGAPSETPGPASLCLAILVGLLVLVIPLLYLAGLFDARPQEHTCAWLRGRGSLRAPPICLVLIRAVVLRT